MKFLVSAVEGPVLLSWLRLSRGAFGEAFPARWVNSVYFDTLDYEAVVENLSGVSERAKIRYRWYGEEKAPDRGVLEVKKKRNVFGWKLRFEVRRRPWEPGADWPSIRRSLEQQVPSEGRLWIEANPVPIVTIRYLRRYFVSADQRTRITVDSESGVWDQRFRSCPNLDSPARTHKDIVIEIKFDRGDSVIVPDKLESFPLRAIRHSKYVNGFRSIQV